MVLKPIDLTEQFLGEYTDTGNEFQVKKCPFCKPSKSDNLWKFYINKETGVFDCKRANSCGRSGSFYELAKHFGVQDRINYDNYKTSKPKFKLPDVNLQPITDETILNYLEMRGFDEGTIEKVDIKQYNHYTLDKCIAFEYYKNNLLTFIKYRNLKKKNKGRKYRREKDTKPILWNMDNVNPDKPVLITEGEFDLMAAIQSGYENGVSIPSGSEDFNWLDYCWDFIEEVEEFIIWVDNDKAGKDLEEKLIAKLGEDRCRIVEQEKYNDINEMLYSEDEEAVLEKIEEAKQAPIDGIIRLAEVEYFDVTDIEAAPSGFKELDRSITGFQMGTISVWTGENESGKSTLLGQMMAESINAGYNVCAFSGELPKYVFRNWIEKQMASERYILCMEPEGQDERYVVDRHIKEYMGKWYFDNFFLYDADKRRVNADIVLDKFEQTAKRYNCRVFLIDNLIKMNLGMGKENYYRAQSEFIDKCSVFAHKHNCHIHIVAHPRKTEGKVDKMAISGSGDITNLADNVFLVNNHSNNIKKDYDSSVAVLKDRMFGKSGKAIKLLFNEKDLRFAEIDDPIQFDRKYCWETQYEKEGKLFEE